MPFRNISTSGSFISRDLSFYEENIDATAEYDDDTDPSNQVRINAFDVGHNKDINNNNQDDQFGKSVAVGCGRIVAGAYLDDYWDPTSGYSSADWHLNQGSVYIHDLSGTLITKLQNPAAAFTGDTPQNNNDQFGWSVAVGSDKIVVGAPLKDGSSGQTNDAGRAYVFDLDGNNRIQLHVSSDISPRTGSGDKFGWSVAVGCGRIVVGAPLEDLESFATINNTGAVYIFDLDGNLITRIIGNPAVVNDNFGHSVAVGSGRIVVGAPYNDIDSNNGNAGRAYIFDLNGNQIKSLTATVRAGGEEFGVSVAAGSGRIVVGARIDSTTTLGNGAAYIYDLDGNEINKIKSSAAAYLELFGTSVAVGSGRIVVGAPLAGFDSTLGWTGGSTSYGTCSVFDLEGALIDTLDADDKTSTGENFGTSVAAGSGRIVVGDPFLNSPVTSAADDGNTNISIGDSIDKAGGIYIHDTPLTAKHHLDILD
jgi:hypothetical protein